MVNFGAKRSHFYDCLGDFLKKKEIQKKGSSWALTVGRSDLFWGRSDSQILRYFGQLENKLATCITHTTGIVIKMKEN